MAPLAASLNAQAGNTKVGDVTLTGTVTWLVGKSAQTVPVTLTALADGTSQEVYGLASGTLTEQWSGPDGGASIDGWGADGRKTMPAGGSIASPGFAWFGPVLLMARAASAGWGGSDHGIETHDGAPAEHIAIWPTPAKSGTASNTAAGRPAAALRRQSRADLYLDPATHLPRAAVFWIRPTGAPGKRPPAHPILAPEEIRYTAYSAVNGVLEPTQMEVLLGQHTIMRISITSVLVNSGASIAALQ